MQILMYGLTAHTTYTLTALLAIACSLYASGGILLSLWQSR